MRVPFGSRAYDYVFSFFTSFGYFDDPAEQAAVVRNIARSLKPGGRLVLDYLNPRYADAHLTPEEVVTVDGVAFRSAAGPTAAAFSSASSSTMAGLARRSCIANRSPDSRSPISSGC